MVVRARALLPGESADTSHLEISKKSITVKVGDFRIKVIQDYVGWVRSLFITDFTVDFCRIV